MTKMDDEEREDLKRTRHIDEPLGARLRALREDRGLTQAQMGHELGISANQWGRHESGKNRVPAARLWQFCKAMNVDVAAIYEGLPFQILRDGEYSVAGMGEREWAPGLAGHPAEAAPQPLVQRRRRAATAGSASAHGARDCSSVEGRRRGLSGL